MDGNMEFSEVCRLCLSKKDRNINIFAENDPGEETLISKIRACVDVEVLREDDLPKQICLQCSCHINLWYYYKQNCVNSQEKLKAWYSEQARSNERHLEIAEVNHIKQEPPNFPCESFQERNLGTSQNSIAHNAHSPISDEENVAEDMDSTDNRLNLISNAMSIPAESMPLDDGMGPTVIELQPEDEDLLRTVVESEEELESQGGDGDSGGVTLLHVGKEDPGVEMMEEITFDENTNQSLGLEETLEESLESPIRSALLEPPIVTAACSIPLVRVKVEKIDWPHPVATESTAVQKQVSSPTPASGSSPLSWKCPKCPRTFSSNKTKNIHVAKSHKDKSENGPVSVEAADSPARLPLPKIVTAFYDEEAMLCKICDRSFASHHYLWRHLRQSHEDQKPFACQVCRRFFKTKRELTSHRLRTISKLCRRGNTIPRTDISKMCTVNPAIPNNVQGRYTCKECPMQFKCFSFVKRHFTLHTGELPYECPKCKKEFRDYKAASAHFKACNAPLPAYVYTPSASALIYKCPKCSKIFGHVSSLWKHKKRGTCFQKQFCSSCCQSIDSSEWKTHSALCNPSSEKLPRKRVERTSLTLQDILDIHKNVRNDPQELKCKVCNSTFATLKSLKAHIRKHSALPDAPSSTASPSQGAPSALKCDICNLTVQHESTLRSHMESYHGEGIPAVKATNAPLAKHKARLTGFASSKLKCDQCHKLFSSMSALQFHKRTHKPRESCTLGCPFCKKVFISGVALSNHKRIHTSLQLKMKIYKCNFCDNSYSDAKELKLHKTSAHPQEAASPSSETVFPKTGAAPENSVAEDVPDPPKPTYMCVTCGKNFTSEIALTRHKKLHEASQDINRFWCATCSKSFLSSKSFDSHKGWHSRSSTSLPPMPKILLHPKVKSQRFDCPVCSKMFLHKANAKRHMIMQNHNYKGPPLHMTVNGPVTGATKTEYKCKECPQVFHFLTAYKKHVQEHRNDLDGGGATGDVPEERSFVCKLCKKTLRSLKGYKKHLLNHSNRKSFKCNRCCNQYSSATALTKHQHAHALKAFSCNGCKTCFSEKEELILHYESCDV